ncbi:MAG: penicillin-binding protein 2 [Chloroflexi bacterium GWC2_73_18]|nr:MAG: penicillin-binding protein 2 [Chloroflexi bacterium GWC2_73_18]
MVTRPAQAERSGLARRFIVFAVLVALVASLLGTRLFYLQISRGGYYAGRSDANRVVLQPIPSTRGLIHDRQGRPLVSNVPSFAVKIRPTDLPTSRRPAVVGRLSLLLGIPATDINKTIDAYAGSRFELVRIAGDVPAEVARLISEEHLLLPGVEVDVEANRQYLYGPLLSQVLGYTGPIDADELKRLREAGYLADDVIGKAGVEAMYEQQLRGRYGLEQVERDATGREVQVLATAREAETGASLELTIDLRAQELAEQALTWAMRLAKLKRGVVIVMNPQTGEILAMVSLPAYDDNLFAGGISNEDYQALLADPDQPLLNHAISEQYPPGSTYKLVTGTGGLADEKITSTTRLDTRPYLSIGAYRYYEWNHRGWGPLTLYDGFGHSSDTFFFQVAGMLGIDRLAYWAKQYGFGAPTGIDLPAEAAGIVPSNQWKLETFGQGIFPGETYQAGIGQGYDAVTPLQLLNAYAALANGGKLYEPRVLRRVIDADGNVIEDYRPTLIRELPVDPSVLQTMRVAARRVVFIRHTYNLVELPIMVAGKSGTAEFGVRDSQGRLPFHSWFVAFVPKAVEKPDGRTPDEVEARIARELSRADSELAVVALAFESNTKGNVATEIVKYFLQLYYELDVDKRIPQLFEPGNFYQSP